MKNDRILSLCGYSFKTLFRSFWSFAVLLIVEAVGLYLLTTSMLLYKCSGNVVSATALPYSGWYIASDEESEEAILNGEFVATNMKSMWELLYAHECVEDMVYSMQSSYSTDIKLIKLYDKERTEKAPVTITFSSEPESDFRNGKSILIKGRHIVRGDEKCVIISDEVAELNGLSVGDKIKLGGSESGYKIVGIYTSLKTDAAISTYEDIPSNFIYRSNSGIEYSSRDYDTMVKFADGMDKKSIEEFADYISNFPYWFGKKISFLSVDEVNRSGKGGVSAVYNITFTLSIMICITMMFVIGIVVYYHILSRQKEIGMLRTIGEKRISLIFLIELLLTTLFAALIGSTAACLTSRSIASKVFALVNDLLSTSNLNNTNSSGINSVISKQQMTIEYMTAKAYLSVSAICTAAAFAAVIIVTLIFIRRSKRISPIEVMGRQ